MATTTHYLTILDAAMRLEVSTPFIEAICKSGRLTSKTQRGQTLITPHDLDAFCDRWPSDVAYAQERHARFVEEQHLREAEREIF